MLPSSATSVTIWPSSSLIGCPSSTTSPAFRLVVPRTSTTASSAAVAAKAVPSISAAASAGSLPFARMAYSDTLVARGIHAAPPAISQYGKRRPVKRMGGLCLTRELKLRLPQRIGKPIRKFWSDFVKEPGHELGGRRRGHLPVARDQRPRTRMEKGVCQAREGFPAE